MTTISVAAPKAVCPRRPPAFAFSFSLAFFPWSSIDSGFNLSAKNFTRRRSESLEQRGQKDRRGVITAASEEEQRDEALRHGTPDYVSPRSSWLSMRIKADDGPKSAKRSKPNGRMEPTRRPGVRRVSGGSAHRLPTFSGRWE
jgi:hypothetical protein